MEKKNRYHNNVQCFEEFIFKNVNKKSKKNELDDVMEILLFESIKLQCNTAFFFCMLKNSVRGMYDG